MSGISFLPEEGSFFDPAAPFWEKIAYDFVLPRSEGILPMASITTNPDLLGEIAVDNKRVRVDRRRRHPFLADWRWGLRGRRKCLRRGTDSHNTHAVLDWYHPSLLFFIVATYVLSGIDAILTLTLLEFRVAEEANPFMHFLLAEDIRLFAGVKALITGFALIVLTAYSNQRLFTKLRVDRVIYALFAIYALLVVHEVQLLKMAESSGWAG